MFKQELLDFIKNFQPLRVLVAGDLMLDHYIFGKVDRISPEAPVPILVEQEEKFLLGGAGSCVANLKELGNLVEIAALCGDDNSGIRLRHILQKQIGSTKLLCIPEDYKTTVKTRMFSQKQQLLRVDREQKITMSAQNFGAKFIKWRQKMTVEFSQYQALIFSDYGKGFLAGDLLADLLREAKKQNIFCIVDPAKGADFGSYSGANCIKPNRLEAEQFTGIKLQQKKDYVKAAEIICKECDITTVALSLDSEGLLIYQQDRHYFFGVTPQSVFDVTGAGDLVVSVLCLVLASGASLQIAGKLANIAASIAIRNLGNYHPCWKEIAAEIEKNF